MSEKVFKASARRRREAREKGQVAKSTELCAFITLSTTLALCFYYKDALITNFRQILLLMYTNPNESSLTSFAVTILKKIGVMLLPIFAASVIAAIASNVMQVGFFLSFKIITPNLSRISPAGGFKRLFSKRGAVNLLKTAVKAPVIVYIIYSEYKKIISPSLGLFTTNIHASYLSIFKYLQNITIKVLVFLGVLSAVDFIYQKIAHEKDLNMTLQEMMDEFKMEEGNPENKKSINAMRIKLTRGQIKKVKEATFVVTNPTHFAVALKYDSSTAAPLVVFKGVDEIAQEIKKVAREANIPIVENRPLARGLFFNVKIGDAIPKEFYAAVINVIKYLFKLDNNNNLVRRTKPRTDDKITEP